MLARRVYSPLSDCKLLYLADMANPQATRLLIGLHGPAGSGKDTIGDYLRNSWMFKKASFAGPLKDACAAMFGIPRDMFEDRDLKEKVVGEWGVSPRHTAQWMGTEVMRDQFATDFFLKRMDITLNNGGGRMVITDVRYDNEAEYIKRHGGYVWKINAGGRIAQLDSTAAAHASEKGINSDLIDTEIDNSGGIYNTFQEVDHHLLGLPNF